MRVLFFAQLRDVTGRAEIEWPMEASLTAQDLWEKLLAVYPGLRPHRRTVRFARNGEYAMADAVFADTDEVALIPPVSGG